MPDYPYVYPDSPLRPVQPWATRLRVFRRRPGAGGQPEEPTGSSEAGTWETLLREAVEELNEAFQQGGSPFTCALEDDEAGLVLRLRHAAGHQAQEPPEEVEEVLEPADLPAWLGRLRARLGLLVDETA